ncbi:MAG: SUMF1/EgtB/PvdO family nonheme iron enzyme [Rhodothermales bacterium]
MVFGRAISTRCQHGRRNWQVACWLAACNQLKWLRGSARANRVVRGGSWNNNNNNVRCAYRNNNNPNNRNNNVGFRIVLLIFFAPGIAGRVRLAGRGRKKAELVPGLVALLDLWQGHITTAPCLVLCC